MSIWAKPPEGLDRAALGPQEKGVRALLQMAKQSVRVRDLIVQHEAVQRHLISMSGQAQEFRQQSDRHVPLSLPAAIPPGLWRHSPPGGAPGAGDHVQAPAAARHEVAELPQRLAHHTRSPCQLALALEEPASGADERRPCLSAGPRGAGPSDSLLAYLVEKARGQQEAQEPVRVGPSVEEQASVLRALVGGMENLVDEQLPAQPPGRKPKRKSGKGEIEEPLREGDTAMIAKGLHPACLREDVYAVLEENGFTNTFDLLYVPKDFEKHTNKGYFHINFKEAVDAEKFARLVQSSPTSLPGKSSRLVVCRARFQGLHSFLNEVVRGRKLRIEHEENRPWIYFPGSSDKGCSLTKEMTERLLSSESPM